MSRGFEDRDRGAPGGSTGGGDPRDALEGKKHFVTPAPDTRNIFGFRGSRDRARRSGRPGTPAERDIKRNPVSRRANIVTRRRRRSRPSGNKRYGYRDSLTGSAAHAAELLQRLRTVDRGRGHRAKGGVRTRVVVRLGRGDHRAGHGSDPAGARARRTRRDDGLPPSQIGFAGSTTLNCSQRMPRSPRVPGRQPSRECRSTRACTGGVLRRERRSLERRRVARASSDGVCRNGDVSGNAAALTKVAVNPDRIETNPVPVDTPVRNR